MSIINRIKTDIDLKVYLENHERHTFSGSKTLCPFHEDRTPSMDVNLVNGRWNFYCHACEARGDIINYLEKKHGLPVAQIIQRLSAEYGLNDPSPTKTEYIYREASGNEVFKKIKTKDASGKKNYAFFHKHDGRWASGKGPHEVIPYNLDHFAEFPMIVVTEGEKDADTINRLGVTDMLATTAPFGQKSWDDSLTKHFMGKEIVYFLYDVGAEPSVEQHAGKIKASLPDLNIYIAAVPMEKRESDITEYLNKFKDQEIQKEKLDEILTNAEQFQPGQELPERGNERIFVGTLEALMETHIPDIENLVKPYVFRGGLTEVGGVKGSHKSFFVTNLALYFAAGLSPFLTATIQKPGRVLLIQQEISMGYMRRRLQTMQAALKCDTGGRFIPVTTTAKQLKLLNNKDYDIIRGWIDQYEPDILILDPLSTFNTTEENKSKDMTKVVNRLNEIKAEFNLGLVITHHFSSKRSPNDPQAPIEAGAWFRGSTILSDAADALICLHRLSGQRENPNLPLPYEDYNHVQIDLRNERAPGKFAIEFDAKTFLLKVSDIWEEIGKRIMPGQIEELLRANDGEMYRRDVISYFKQTASPSTVKRAINEAVSQNRISKEQQQGRGSPVLLKLVGIQTNV